jgi:hypothetical protein
LASVFLFYQDGLVQNKNKITPYLRFLLNHRHIIFSKYRNKNTE